MYIFLYAMQSAYQCWSFPKSLAITLTIHFVLALTLDGALFHRVI